MIRSTHRSFEPPPPLTRTQALLVFARTCLRLFSSTNLSVWVWAFERAHLPQGSRSAAIALLQALPRKEVIQAHLPVHLPCYDFVPVTSPTLGGSLLAVRIPTSGVTSSHDVTGGVYKARERIHRSLADLRLLAIPTFTQSSCRLRSELRPYF